MQVPLSINILFHYSALGCSQLAAQKPQGAESRRRIRQVPHIVFGVSTDTCQDHCRTACCRMWTVSITVVVVMHFLQKYNFYCILQYNFYCILQWFDISSLPPSFLSRLSTDLHKIWHKCVFLHAISIFNRRGCYFWKINLNSFKLNYRYVIHKYACNFHNDRL